MHSRPSAATYACEAGTPAAVGLNPGGTVVESSVWPLKVWYGLVPVESFRAPADRPCVGAALKFTLMTSGAKDWPSWQPRQSWFAGALRRNAFGPEPLSQLPLAWTAVETGAVPSQLWLWLKCIVWQSVQTFVVPACHSPARAGRAITARTAAIATRSFFIDFSMFVCLLASVWNRSGTPEKPAFVLGDSSPFCQPLLVVVRRAAALSSRRRPGCVNCLFPRRTRDPRRPLRRPRGMRCFRPSTRGRRSGRGSSLRGRRA